MLPQPSNLVADGVLHTSAALIWEMNDTGPKYYPVQYYDVVYKLSHSEEDIEHEIRTEGKNLANLNQTLGFLKRFFSTLTFQ